MPKSLTYLANKAYQKQKAKKCSSCGKSYISYTSGSQCFDCWMAGK